MIEEVVNKVQAKKPLSPEQARIDSLKKAKDVATKKLKAERDRQRVAKAREQIRLAMA